MRTWSGSRSSSAPARRVSTSCWRCWTRRRTAASWKPLLHHLPWRNRSTAGNPRSPGAAAGDLGALRGGGGSGAARRLPPFLRLPAVAQRLPHARLPGVGPQRGRRAGAAGGCHAIASHRELLADTWMYSPRPYSTTRAPSAARTPSRASPTWTRTAPAPWSRAAFRSPDEGLRAAAVSSAAGDRIPEELTGGDAAAYLISELRAACTPGYKRAILKRIVGDPREIYEEAIRGASRRKEAMGMQQSYRQALEAMEDARTARAR